MKKKIFENKFAFFVAITAVVLLVLQGINEFTFDGHLAWGGYELINKPQSYDWEFVKITDKYWGYIIKGASVVFLIVMKFFNNDSNNTNNENTTSNNQKTDTSSFKEE